MLKKDIDDVVYPDFQSMDKEPEKALAAKYKVSRGTLRMAKQEMLKGK